MYKNGTLKVTWINKDDFTILRSQMFNKSELSEAIAYGKKMSNGNDFMIFELVSASNDDNYTWKLLPYGDAERFVSTMENFESIYFKAAIVTVIGLAFFGLYKIFAK